MATTTTGFRRTLSSGTLRGTNVHNREGEGLGEVEEIMIDLPSGRIAYAVLSFGGFLGMGEKLFAVPWAALSVDEKEERLVLDADRERLKNAPGFDKRDWPDFADPAWAESVHAHYGATPYWR